MGKQSVKSLTVDQLKLIHDGLELLDEHLLAVCEGCQFRHHKDDCPLPEADGRMCFDTMVWQSDFMKRNIKALYLREKLNQQPKERNNEITRIQT